MRNKVGAIVAIEPGTGEILSLVSSPGIDVSRAFAGELRGDASQTEKEVKT